MMGKWGMRNESVTYSLDLFLMVTNMDVVPPVGNHNLGWSWLLTRTLDSSAWIHTLKNFITVVLEQIMLTIPGKQT
jgi:hypothetical protein